jgi:hypothetical protein
MPATDDTSTAGEVVVVQVSYIRASIWQPDREAAPLHVSMQDGTGAQARAFARPDGVELYLREYLVHSGTVARGLVVLVHGWNWHSGYFKPCADFLVSKGAR